MKARKGQRGGSSGGKRTRAHVEVGIREVLSELMRARADPATRRIVALERRHDVVDVSWDLFIADDDGRRWHEVKDGEVKGDDIVDFARKVAACFAVDRAEEFILRTRLMGGPARAIERLAGLAREPGDQLVTSGPLTPHERAVIEALGDDSQGKLRRVRIETYSSKENADATRNDALLLAAMKNSIHLRAHVRERVEKAADNKSEIDVTQLLREIEERCAYEVVTLTGGHAHDALALARAVPDPLPADVVAGALDISITRLLDAARVLIDAGLITTDGEMIRASAGSWELRAKDHSYVLAQGLQALVVDCDRNKARARGQLKNLEALGRACLEDSPQLVARIFEPVQKTAKTEGHKHRVLTLAQLTIDGARRSLRGRDEIRAEALALVCGVAWVLQRVGELEAARTAITRSRRLGEAIGWPRNDAFCAKCAGRLDRMLAEQTDSDDRQGLLQSSETQLREAIGLFEALREEEEIGDAWSLLARTYLVWQRYNDVHVAIDEARKRLFTGPNKDYVDLVLVEADWERLRPRGNLPRAGALYREALELATHDQADRSEMRARALTGLAELVGSQEGSRMLEEAARIYTDLQEADSAARARLRAIALARRLVPELEAKQLDPLDLFYAHQVHFEHQRELAKVGVEHRTPRRDKAYWNSVVGDGRLRAAAERRPWQ